MPTLKERHAAIIPSLFPSPIQPNLTLPEEEIPDEPQLSVHYKIEIVLYVIAIILGFIASIYTIRKYRKCRKKNLDAAARLMSYKISLSIADALILFVYAPAQVFWITTYWWYGGGILCKIYKFTVTFGYHLTGNMQVLIAFDRLISMTRINKLHVKGTSDYNTRLFLSIAWILAFACSVPQLFIFKIVYLAGNVDNPQCGSIWTENSQNFALGHEELLAQEINETVYEERLFILEREMQEGIRLENMYNIVHITMMCVLPYLLELVFYAIILSLLSDAEKGEFSGFRRFLRKKIVQLCQFGRSGERKERFSSLPTVVEDPQTESPVRTPQIKINLARRPSRSVNSSPTRKIDALRVSYNRNRFQSVDVGVRRMTMAVDANGSVAISSLQKGMENNNKAGERSQLLSIRHQSRRASAPCGDNKINEKRVSAPWMKTVVVARRNARKKAFLMLSFNLLFWLPYCIHAVLSSFTEINFVNFQFVCALVVFNAITNILL